MNILENQVTDLNYLAESPIQLPGDMNGRRESSSAESPADPQTGSGKKRKADADENNGEASINNGSGAGAGAGSAAGSGATHTRAKRNRYISIACNECKRRKIKCNGNNPCLRCGNLNLECQYAPNCCTNGFKDSEEFRQMNTHLSSLQDQVDTLFANLNALRNGGNATPFANSPEGSSVSIPQLPLSIPPALRYRPRLPSFRGPTSSAFSLDVARNTLHSMGYQNPGDENNTQDPTPVGSPPAAVQLAPLMKFVNGNTDRDPIWALNKEEMVRLCRVYEEEMGIMYPVLNIEDIITHGKNLYDFMEAMLRNGLAHSSDPSQGVNDEQSCTLKMVLAISTVVEGSGKSDIGYRLFESVKNAAYRILHSETFELKSLPFLALVAIYHFHCDEEALAWRVIGQVARMCLELGLHNRHSLFKAIKDDQERASAIKLFWSIYVLDRRWSFGTGMPFALQDADIDPALPEPELDVPYLNVMIAYSRLSSKAWRSISSHTPSAGTPLNVDEIGYLDYQILQWQKSIPSELQLPIASSPITASRAIHRLQILLYLRANQMRILIYRPVLHTASSIQENLSYANTVVELAKDTIRALTHLNQTTDIYRVQQVCFNYFLISALAVIFLASSHAPVHFSAACREEFYMALDLVKGFSNKSWVSKRLWKTIRGLKEYGPKLGLAPGAANTNALENDPHASAALVMAGLSGQEISGMGYGNGSGQGNVGHEGGRLADGGPMNGFQMSYEMTNLFEAALGSVGVNGVENGDGGYVPVSEGDYGTPGVGAPFGADAELYLQLRDLF